jgi:hypothetical protein
MTGNEDPIAEFQAYASLDCASSDDYPDELRINVSDFERYLRELREVRGKP